MTPATVAVYLRWPTFKVRWPHKKLKWDCQIRVTGSRLALWNGFRPTSIHELPHKGLMNAATFMSNSTAFQDPLKIIHQEFSLMFSRKAFLQWYLKVGMEELEFTEAEANVKDLLQEYQMQA